MGFSMYAGDNRRLDLIMTDPQGVPVDLTGAVLTWRAGLSPQGAVILEKLGVIDGLPVDGRFHVDLVPADTSALAGTFHHWVHMVVAGVVSTIYYGTFSIDPLSAIGSIAAFKERFPEFALVSDSLIGAMFAEVSPGIGENWRAADRVPALQYRVAHMLAMEGYGTVVNSQVGIGGVGAMKRRKVGDVEVEFATSSGGAGGGASGSEYKLTTYGQAYLRLLRSNFMAVAVV